MEYIYEYVLEIVECKFARNGLTNWKTCLTNLLKNIIWHLFAGESHHVVKITVPYQCTSFAVRIWAGQLVSISSFSGLEVAPISNNLLVPNLYLSVSTVRTNEASQTRKHWPPYSTVLCTITQRHTSGHSTVQYLTLNTTPHTHRKV
jgi:hypothetical protein